MIHHYTQIDADYRHAHAARKAAALERSGLAGALMFPRKREVAA